MKIAYDAHKEQIDKNGITYIYHPIHLAEQMDDENSICVALLHDDAVLYMDYVRVIKKNPIATKVKLADLRHNSDLTRLDVVDEKAMKRAEKYKEAIKILEER